MLASLDVGGGDLRFSSDEAGTTQLACEIVDGLDVVWVSTDGLSVATGLTIYVWGDNTGASQPATGAAFGRDAVWVDYRAIYHLSETANTAAGGYLDSTGNGYDGTGVNMSEANRTLPSGLIGSGFNGTDESITIPLSVFPTTAQPDYTVMCFAQPDILSVDSRVFMLGNTSNDDDVIVTWMDAGGTGDGWALNTKNSGVNLTLGDNDNNAQAGRWDFITNKFTSTQAFIRVNGSQTASGSLGGSAVGRTIDEAHIGKLVGGSTTYMNGGISELRLALETLGDDELDIIYDNQSTTGSWWVASDVAGGTTGTITQNTAAFTQSLAGSTVAPPTTGTINQSATAFTQSALGSVTQLGITGVITQAISAFTQSLAGDVVSSGVNGSITQTTGSFTQALLGNTVLNVTGTVTQSSSAFTQSLIGTTAEQISGIITQSVSSFTQSLVGEVPAQWIDKPRAVTIWGDNTPVFTLWTDK
jgi:hypothetical protein